MNKKGLEAIYKSIAKTSIKEVTIKTSRGAEVKIIRSEEEMAGQTKAPSKAVTSAKVAKAAKTAALAKEGIANNEQQMENENHHDICAPHVGFFKRFNNRTKKQYVKLRDEVTKGTVVGTILSMHVPHDVVADKDGKIVAFLVENDQPVEFNQPVVRIEIH